MEQNEKEDKEEIAELGVMLRKARDDATKLKMDAADAEHSAADLRKRLESVESLIALQRQKAVTT